MIESERRWRRGRVDMKEYSGGNDGKQMGQEEMHFQILLKRRKIVPFQEGKRLNQWRLKKFQKKYDFIENERGRRDEK